MKRYYPEDTDAGMFECEDGPYVRYADAAEFQSQLADVTRERDEWKQAHDLGRQVIEDLGRALGANMPAELVNEVARRRMAEIADLTRERDTLRAMLELQNAKLDRVAAVIDRSGK